MVEHSGIEPPTSSLRTRRSPSWANVPSPIIITSTASKTRQHFSLPSHNPRIKNYYDGVTYEPVFQNLSIKIKSKGTGNLKISESIRNRKQRKNVPKGESQQKSRQNPLKRYVLGLLTLMDFRQEHLRFTAPLCFIKKRMKRIFEICANYLSLMSMGLFFPL